MLTEWGTLRVRRESQVCPWARPHLHVQLTMRNACMHFRPPSFFLSLSMIGEEGARERKSDREILFLKGMMGSLTPFNFVINIIIMHAIDIIRIQWRMLTEWGMLRVCPHFLLSLSLSDWWTGLAHPPHRSERERERGRDTAQHAAAGPASHPGPGWHATQWHTPKRRKITENSRFFWLPFYPVA